MRQPNLLAPIIDAQIRLERDGDHIRIHGPQSLLTKEWMETIKQNKTRLMEVLAERDGRFQASRLTHGQRALWSLYRLEPESPVYNLVMVLRLAPETCLDRLQKALDKLVSRHESLRTTFEEYQGEPIQVIHPRGVLPLSVHDASSWSEAQSSSWLEEQKNQPFNLERGPLMRAHLTRGVGTESEDLLVITTHHIISDFLTFAVICQELNRLYAWENDSENEDRGVPTQFRHVVRQQSHWLESSAAEAAWAFWRNRLEKEMPLLDLPLARPRPPVQSFRGEKLRFQLDPGLSDRIRSFATSHGATPYMVMLTAFQIFLYRYTGRQSFPMGTFVAGRNHPATEGVLGYLTNPVVQIANIAPSSGFARQLASVREDVLSAMAHEDYPFAKLVEKLGIKRNPGYSPVFQVVFLWEFAQWQQELRSSDDPIRDVTMIDQGGAPFDLIFSLTDEGTGAFSGMWLSNPDMFDEASVAQLHRHFQNLLAVVLVQPQRSCLSLPLLSASETERAWVAWNQTSTRFPTGLCLQEMVIHQAAKTPDAPAVICGQEEISYARLIHSANQLARELLSHDVVPEQLVAVVMTRGWRQVAAVLGVQIAGAAYLPIDPDWPRDRRWQVMEQGRITLVVADESLEEAEHWPSHVSRFCIDPEPVSRDDYTVEVLPTRQSPNHLAYVIFTSGSSGQPKGVAIEHAAAANTLHDINRRHALGAQDRVLGLSALSFDLSVYDIFGMLSVGGALVLPSREESRDPAAWQGLVTKHQVTLWNTVPALMQLFISHCEEHPNSEIGCIRTVMMSGDWIPVDLPDRIRALSPQTRVFSYGGATEASIWSISYSIEQVRPEWRSIPYGKAMANQTFFVLDKNLEPCPVGVAGDLFIGGVGLARGYFGDEAKTAASFIIHPRRGERLYRTGDLGRYFPDGNIAFLGRADSQVKVNGYRIELAEIERVLLDDARVKEAAVAVHDREDGGRRLVAYVVLTPSTTVLGDELKAWVATKLPKYMVPAVMTFLDQMPLSANGKVDRKALPKPEDTLPRDREQIVAPQTPLEKALAEIWAEVLGVPGVGLNDNYFELGGDSILSIQIASRARQMGIKLSTRLLFLNPTLKQLTPHVAIEELEETKPSFPEAFPSVQVDAALQRRLDEQVGKVEIESVLPVSPRQYSVLYPSLLHDDAPLYFVQLSFSMNHAVNVMAWHQAWRELIRRHATFRTFFMDLEEEAPIQVCCREVDISLEEIDFRHVDEPFQEREFEAFLARDRKIGFRLDQAPISRLYLIRTGKERYRFLWSHHHVICDGWSFVIILRELFSLYQAFWGNTEHTLAAPSDFRRFLDRPNTRPEQPHREWWRNYLRGFRQPSRLTRDWVSHREGRIGVSFEVKTPRDASVTEAVDQLIREQGITAHILLLGIWALLLHHQGGEDDVVFGVTQAGRPPDVPDVEHMVGLFINSVPARIQIDGDTSLMPWLRDIHHQQLETMAHSFLPLSTIQQCSEIPAGKPLFDSLLVVENLPMVSALRQQIEVLQISDLQVVTRNNFPLTLNATPGASFALKIMVNDTRIDHHGALRVADHCRLLLEGIASAPECRLRDLLQRLSDHDRADQAHREEAVIALSAQKLSAARRRRGRQRN